MPFNPRLPRFGPATAAAFAGVIVGAALIATVAPIREPHPENRVWAEALTGVVASINDVVALELIPAVLGLNELPAAGAAPGGEPDLPRVVAACDKLVPTVERLRPLAKHPPGFYRRAAADVRRLLAAWNRALVDCTRLAAAGGWEEFRQSLQPQMLALGELTAKVGRHLPNDVRCPPQLQPRPQTCDAGQEIL